MTITQKASARQLDRWIHQIGQGDRDALAQLYQATATPVYAYALSILKNRHDAEDVLQECYVSICRSAISYTRQEKPMAWIMTITRNLCLKLLRQQKRYIPLEDAHFGAEDTDSDLRLLLDGCMKLLSDQDRQIVVLHAVAGCTHAQIGKHLGLKTGTVLSKYHRAIQKLRSSLGKEDLS